MIPWVVFCFMVLAGTKVDGRCKCPHSSGGALVLTAGWQFPHVRLHVAVCVSSHSARQLGPKMVHSKHRGESCRSARAEPRKLCVTSNILVAKGVTRPAQIPGERKRTPFNGKTANKLQPCLTTTAHSLSTNLHSHAYKACSPSPQVPPRQSFSPLRHRVQASNPGSCHLNQVLNAMRQCP